MVSDFVFNLLPFLYFVFLAYVLTFFSLRFFSLLQNFSLFFSCVFISIFAFFYLHHFLNL